MASGLQSVVTTSGTMTMELPPYARHSDSPEAQHSDCTQRTFQMQYQLVIATLEKCSLPALVVAMPGVILKPMMDGARLGQELASV